MWPAEGQLELYETQIFKKVIFVDYSSQYFCCFFFFFIHTQHAMECGEDLFSGRRAGQRIHGDAMLKWFY